MNKDDWIGILIIAGIIIIGLTGGFKGAGVNGLVSNGTGTPTQKQSTYDIQKQIKDAEKQVDSLKQQVQNEEDKKTHSIYYGKIQISYVNRSTDPEREYIALRVNNATTTIPITGWTLKSLSSGATVTIPKGSYLFFADSINADQDIYVTGNDTVYVTTGHSPNGVSFKLNKCSGYLNQFQTFIPYIGQSCPAPKNEDLSSIPNTVNNDACLEYIETFPRCRIQTRPLPENWSSECYNFIYNKINYPSCVNAHKNDKDFYLPEWRIFLKRGSSIWKDRREHIVLYDNIGKIVSELEY